jgi:methionine-gamma-lyase
MHKSTKAIHVGTLERPVYGEVSVPIFQTSTFAFPSAEEGAARFIGEKPGYIYTRMGNPTVKALEDNIAALENGFAGMATASGMAAIGTVFLSLLSQGDHLLASECLYGPTHVMIEGTPRLGITTFVILQKCTISSRRSDPMIFMNPTNPTLEYSENCGRGHRHGAFVRYFASPIYNAAVGGDLVISLSKILREMYGMISQGCRTYKRIRKT